MLPPRHQLEAKGRASDVSNSFIIPMIKEIWNIARENTPALPCADISLCFVASEQKEKQMLTYCPYLYVYQLPLGITLLNVF